MGALPLVPYVVNLPGSRFAWSIGFAYSAMFGVGASRASISNSRWWTAGPEMLGLGIVVTAVAYGAGALVASLLDG